MTSTSEVRINLNIIQFIFQTLVVFNILVTNMCYAENCVAAAQKVKTYLKESDEEKEVKKGLQTFIHQDNTKEFRLRLGEEFRVKLPENPTTGFLWTVLESSSPNIELLGKEFLPPKDPAVIGASGTRVIVFRATKSGRAVLRLGLKQPWKNEKNCANFYSLNLLVD